MNECMIFFSDQISSILNELKKMQVCDCLPRGPKPGGSWSAKEEGVVLEDSAAAGAFGALQLGHRLGAFQRVVLERPLGEEVLKGKYRTLIR